MSIISDFIPTDNIPDNRFMEIKMPKIDDIVIGADCTQVFNLPFVFSEYVDSVAVLYKQGLELLLVKETCNNCSFSECPFGKCINDFDVTEHETWSTLEVHLSPTETASFDKNCLDTHVQLKITTKNGNIVYGMPYKLNIRCPLDYR